MKVAGTLRRGVRRQRDRRRTTTTADGTTVRACDSGESTITVEVRQ